MSTYAVQKIRHPFLCKWKCVHCGSENIGIGQIDITGQSDMYCRYSGKQTEHAFDVALDRSIEALDECCELIIEKVNHQHKYHKALASIKEPCSCCGKKQPWQMGKWIKILRYVLLAVIIGVILMMMISGFVNIKSRWAKIDPKLMMMVKQVGSISGCLFLFTFLLSFSLKRIGFHKAVSMGENFYPEVELACIPTKEELLHPNDHPGIWICPSCNTENKNSRGTCSKCGHIK